MSKSTPQYYPRIENDKESKFNGFLDDSKLKPHTNQISIDKFKDVIRYAILAANKKSSRAILNIPDSASEEEIIQIYKREGVQLFRYFIRYCGDPAATAHACLNNHYAAVAVEQFRNRTLQKERMNSGWRYQYIAREGANLSKRFNTVSDIGTNEADFNVTIEIKEGASPFLNIYVSVKNRVNTMGGQDWPKAIRALEEVAKNDKNRTGPYLCVFGIAMDHGLRQIKEARDTRTPYSINTEIWLSDYFWPFFVNFSYEQVAKAVLDVLIEEQRPDEYNHEVPEELLNSFGDVCELNGLLDENGIFNDAYKLVDIFVGHSKPKYPKSGRLLQGLS